MPIPHFKNITTANRLFEGVYPNLFEISFVLPAILQAQNRDPYLLLENATSIDTTAISTKIETSKQRFKYAERFYVDLPTSTVAEFDIYFNVNQGDAGDVFVYNTLKSWYDLAWFSQLGTAQYKRNIIGTVIVNWHDKQGFVHNRITYHNCALVGISNFGVLAFDDTKILDKITANFVADYWTEEKIDTASQMQLPNIYQ